MITPYSRDNVCVFAGTVEGSHSEYTVAAHEVGKLLARAGFNLVYGGGSTGIMGAIAESIYIEGGDVISVIPECMSSRDDNFANSRHTYVCGSMHERKITMHNLSSAYIVLPGGLGTIEETVEVLSWINLKIYKEPLIFLNTAGYWDSLLDTLTNAIDHQFLDKSIKDAFHVAETPQDVLDILTSFHQKEGVKDVIQKIEDVYGTESSYHCAHRIQQLAGSVGFKWTSKQQAIEKVKEEFSEFIEEAEAEHTSTSRIEEELGDLIFSLINCASYLDLDYNQLLDKANLKFKKRFTKTYEAVKNETEAQSELSLEEWINTWNKLKAKC